MKGNVLRKRNSFSRFSNKRRTRKGRQLPEFRVCWFRSSILKFLSEIFQLGSAPSRIPD
jgi:hypothetical protein